MRAISSGIQRTTRKGRRCAEGWLARGAKYSHRKPQHFRRGGGGASSTPDLVVTGVRGGKLTVLKGGVWQGASEHSPILLDTPDEDTEDENETPRQTSKTALHSEERKKRVRSIYANKFSEILNALRIGDSGDSIGSIQQNHKGNSTPLADVHQQVAKGTPDLLDANTRVHDKTETETIQDDNEDEQRNSNRRT